MATKNIINKNPHTSKTQPNSYLKHFRIFEKILQNYNVLLKVSPKYLNNLNISHQNS